MTGSRIARWLARRERLPTSLRAVCAHAGRYGVVDLSSLRLKSRVDDRVDEIIADAFAEIEQAIAADLDTDTVDFAYDTKLVLPAKLTLGYLYRELDPAAHDRAVALTRLTVEALVDGDMRDAINDAEFGDFEVDVDLDDTDRRRVAELAQDVLEARVRERLADQPAAVREQYEWAVEISESHQAQDAGFRELLARARDGDQDALAEIRSTYKFADFDDLPSLFEDPDRELPYLKTQYDRVGVIYDAMIGMYRAADLPIEAAFQRSIVFAIIGAQLWLDDVDDYEADMAAGQLTPVTAEYLLADTDREAYETVVDTARIYLDRAASEATAADSALTGIATAYIRLEGEPGTLPGSSAAPDQAGADDAPVADSHPDAGGS